MRRQIPWSSSIPPMDIFHAKKPCVSILSPIEIYKTFMLNPTPGQNTTILVCLFEKVSRASHSTLSWCEHVIYWSRVTKMDLCGLNWMKGIIDPVEYHRVVRMGLKEDSRMWTMGQLSPPPPIFVLGWADLINPLSSSPESISTHLGNYRIQVSVESISHCFS